MDPNFWSVFTPGPVLETLAGYLSIGDIVNLSRTCKDLSGLYQELLSRHWDVDQQLKRFVDQPKKFRAQLGLSEALISGSFALQFFERGAWQVPDLDILVVEGELEEMLSEHLVIDEGYSYVYQGDDTPYAFKHVTRVFTFMREREKSASYIRLFLVSSFTYPLRAILEGFWTTSTVAFLSWRMAYSIFPSPTFLHRKSFLLKPPGVGPMPPLKKYCDRGWTFELAIPTQESGPRNPAMRKCRKIDDRLSWKIPFDITSMRVWPDPVDSDDYVYISEVITGVDPETQALLESAGGCRMSENYVHHYEIKYMRWSRIQI